MHVMRRRGWELPERAATPEHLFLDRRALLGAGAVFAATAGMSGKARAEEPAADPTAALYPVKRNEKYVLDRPITDAKIKGAYNNFYEIGSSKLIAKPAHALENRTLAVKNGR